MEETPFIFKFVIFCAIEFVSIKYGVVDPWRRHPGGTNNPKRAGGKIGQSIAFAAFSIILLVAFIAIELR
jgi:hypothetical protein